MTIIEFLMLLVVAGICGSLAQALVGYSRGGCLVWIVLGFIGALLGEWLARATGLPELFVVQIGGRPHSDRVVRDLRSLVCRGIGPIERSPVVGCVKRNLETAESARHGLPPWPCVKRRLANA